MRASLPVGGRSLTLDEEVHTQRKLGNRLVLIASLAAILLWLIGTLQRRFLQRAAGWEQG